jgi:hypothetical protein
MGRATQITTALAISFEFVLATALLALFASAYPDRFRTVLWRDGGSKGWNSDPSYRVYLYANYREMPPMPLIWDERCVLYLVVSWVWILKYETVQLSTTSA